MVKSFLFLIFLLPAFLFSQKQTTQVIDAGNIKTIRLLSDEVFRITIKTAEVNTISIVTKAEGEYFQDIGLISTRKQESLLLESRFRDKLQGGFDKLSAHKVFSFEVELVIPENLRVEIESNIASVNARGTFDFLQIQLKQGHCEVVDFLGNAVVNTYEGDIFFKMKNPAIVNAVSRQGRVIVPPTVGHDAFKLKLISISGDIKVIY